ncbi:MAG: hypothetical protein DRI65_18235 [Chloroflexota bacterium]|nr:MAG: hypothetical protein DRI65_18235 [Chloroflexota bacterium]
MRMSRSLTKKVRLRRQKKCHLGRMLNNRLMPYVVLAEAVGVGENTVGQWVAGKNVPSALVLDDVCLYLSCKVNDIYPE